MSKNTFYFPHDYHARHDPKLQKLFLKYGYEGIGVYWCLIEMLYEQDGYLSLEDIPLYAGQQQTLCERIASIINDFGLFKVQGGRFWSESCLLRLEGINQRSQKASKSAMIRWESITNAMPMHSEGNAIKKEKKERKENIYSAFYSKLLEIWNNHKIIQHRYLTDSCRGHINSRLENGYTEKDILQAIKNYAHILSEPRYYWKYRWTLDEFLVRGLDKFMDLETAKQNYLDKNYKPEKTPEELKLDEELHK